MSNIELLEKAKKKLESEDIKFFQFTSEKNGDVSIVSNISTFLLVGILNKYKNYFMHQAEFQETDVIWEVQKL